MNEGENPPFGALGEKMGGFSALLYLSEDPGARCPCFDGK